MPQGQVGQVVSGGRAGVHGTLAGFGLLARLPGCPSFRSGPSGSGYTPLHPTVRIATGGTAPAFLTAGAAPRWLTVILAQLRLSHCGFTFHSLRRGACSRAYEAVASLPDLQFLGGWRGRSVQLYAPLEAARVQAAQCLVTGPSSHQNNFLAT